jgi:excisionase family DNA binding protein
MRSNEDLYSPKELAEMLGIPIKSLYRWNYLRTGPLPLRVGRHVRYRLNDVNDWLEERAAEARAR